LKNEKISYIEHEKLSNLHAQQLLMTCGAGIRCAQEFTLSWSLFVKHLHQAVEEQ
jgi:hypothetical protein